MTAALALLFTAQLAAATSDLDSRVEPAVLEELARSRGEGVCVVVLLEEPDPAAPRPARRERIFETQELLLADLAGSGFELRCRYRTFAALAGRAGAESIAALARHPLVRRVGPDATFETALAESVPHIRADQAHALGFTGEGVTVAVIDTGIDTDHPDLADDLAPGAWHFLGSGLDHGPGAEDETGHGTHVSGIISSAGTVAPLGVAPDAAILALKVFDTGPGQIVDVLAAIDHLTALAPSRPEIGALNMSIVTGQIAQCPCDHGNATTMALQAALHALREEGVLCFAAASNFGSCTYLSAPACVSAAVAIAATGNADDALASFSNRNPCVELAAPGATIDSTTIGGGSGEESGTSMAAPHVAGTAALILQRARAHCVPVGPDELLQLLKDTGVPTLDSCGTVPNPPRVDALAALVSLDLGVGTPYCFGDGGGAACPCGNESAPGLCQGCRHSAGEGAAARATGSASVVADDLVLLLESSRPSQPALLFAGRAAVGGGNGAGFGDGLRCAGMQVVRLGVRVADAAGATSWGPGLCALGGFAPGETRYAQVWYRDPGGSPCASAFNLSNGVALPLEP